jgi:hypothetical protein
MVQNPCPLVHLPQQVERLEDGRLRFVDPFLARWLRR